jgi:hypothetical protein
MEETQHNISFGDRIPPVDADPKSTGMRNAFIWGAIIGVLSGLWIFAVYTLGYTNDLNDSTISPFEYTSGLIPLIGLYFGVRQYKFSYKNGRVTFLECLVECFKILIVGGVIAVFFAILYINLIAPGTISDFSGRIFGALLIGILSSFAVSLVLMRK